MGGESSPLTQLSLAALDFAAPQLERTMRGTSHPNVSRHKSSTLAVQKTTL